MDGDAGDSGSREQARGGASVEGGYRFGPFVYEDTTGRLYRDGEQLAVAPRTAALLEYLLAHRGRVCTKDELLASVWDEVNVGEESLTQAISVLRQTLGDDARRPAWLETIQRRGYRFIGEVEVLGGAPERAAPQALSRSMLWVAAAVVSLAAVVALAAWATRSGTVVGPRIAGPVRFSIELGQGEALRTSHSNGLALSPDGTRLVLAKKDTLYVRDLAEDEMVSIVGTEGGAAPSFSADGRELMFHVPSRNVLKRVSLAGGEATTVANTFSPRGATWVDESSFLFARGPDGIMRVSPSGGETELVVELAADEAAYGVQPIGDGGWLLSTINRGDGDWSRARIVLLNPATGERRPLLTGTGARYLPTGHIVFHRDRSLWAVAFDAARLAVEGDPVAVVDDVLRAPNAGTAYYTVSDNGVLAYLRGAIGPGARRALLWVDRYDGTVVIDARDAVDNPRLSPDERYIAAVGMANDDRAIWVHELGRGWTLLTTEGNGTNPIWSHDGRAVIFESTRGGRAGIWRRSLDFATPAEPLWQPPSFHTMAPESVSADGRFLYYTAIDGGRTDIHVLDVESPSARPVAGLAEPMVNEGTPILHPSGRYLGYISDETGRMEVYVRELTAPDSAGRRWTISANGGEEPSWSPDGRTIFYRIDELVMAVDMGDGEEIEPSAPRVAIESFLAEPPMARTEYDVAADGRLLVAAPAGIDVSVFSRVHVVVNWFEELERLVPGR